MYPFWHQLFQVELPKKQAFWWWLACRRFIREWGGERARLAERAVGLWCILTKALAKFLGVWKELWLWTGPSNSPKLGWEGWAFIARHQPALGMDFPGRGPDLGWGVSSAEVTSKEGGQLMFVSWQNSQQLEEWVLQFWRGSWAVHHSSYWSLKCPLLICLSGKYLLTFQDSAQASACCLLWRPPVPPLYSVCFLHVTVIAP